MTQGSKPRSGRTRLFSVTHFLCRFDFLGICCISGDMQRHAALSHRLPPAPIPAPPAAPAVEEPPGPPGAPVIPVPPGASAPGGSGGPHRPLPPAEGAVRSWTAALHWELPSLHIFPGTGPRRPPRLPGQQRRCRRGGRSAASPEAGRGAGHAPAAGAEREVLALPAGSRYTRGGGGPAGPGHTGAVGSAWSHGAATAGDIPAHMKYPSPALPRSLALHFRSGFTSLLPPRRQSPAPPSASSCREPSFSPENSFPPHHAIWQCQHLSVPFSITCHKSVLHFQWMTFEIMLGIEEGSPPPPPRQFVSGRCSLAPQIYSPRGFPGRSLLFNIPLQFPAPSGMRCLTGLLISSSHCR